MICDNPFCRIQSPLEIASSGLTLRKTKKLDFCHDNVKGRGVIAGEDINLGDFVCEYKYSTSYPAQRKPVMDEAYDTNGEGSYILEVQIPGGKWICLDATVNLNSWARYINHARPSEANLKPFKPLMVGGKWRVAFLASRDIKAGDELCYDYGQQSHPPEWMRRRKVVLALLESS